MQLLGAMLCTLTFEKTALLEKSTFQPPVNVYEFGLWPFQPEVGNITHWKRTLSDSVIASALVVDGKIEVNLDYVQSTAMTPPPPPLNRNIALISCPPIVVFHVNKITMWGYRCFTLFVICSIPQPPTSGHGAEHYDSFQHQVFGLKSNVGRFSRAVSLLFKTC